jgi:hypothetical protein
MAIVDLLCYNCGNKEMDHFIRQGLIPDGWTPPNCPNCGQQYSRGGMPNFNLKTADLPHGFGEGYQPAFRKYCGSKREAMGELQSMNSRLKEEADKEGRPFSPFEWTPEDKKMEELTQLREEMGAQGITDFMNKKQEEQQETKFKADLETGLQQVRDALG